MKITEIVEKLNELVLYFPNKELPDHGFITIQYRHKLRDMTVRETKDFLTQEQLPVVFQLSEGDCSALLDILANCARYSLNQARTIIHWLEIHRENLREDEYYIEWNKGESMDACGNERDWASVYENILMGAD